MKKYTFICEFRGGTYISQFLATSLSDAVSLWKENLDPIFFPEKIIEKIKLSKDLDEPIAISNIDNVWCISMTINRSFLLLNIIKTV